MNAKVSLIVDANTRAARSEIEALTRTVGAVKREVDAAAPAVQKAGTATERLGEAAEAADRDLTALRSELASMKSALDAMTASEAAAIRQMTALTTRINQLEAAAGRGSRGGGTGAAGAVGNLTAQFNDIGQMLLAGQSPLTLAVQQGTQISQVLGPMGARGAVQSLGGALMGMVSPINLITIGTIAVGAAMFQWLTSSGAQARTLEESLSDLDSRIDTLNQSAKAYSAEGLEEIRAKYGEITAEVLRLVEAERQREIRAARSDVDSAVGALTGDLGAFASKDLARIFETGALRFGRDLKSQIEAIANLDDTAEQIRQLQDLQRSLEVIADGYGNMTSEQANFYDALSQTESAVRRLAAAEQAQQSLATSGLNQLIDLGTTLGRNARERAAAAIQSRTEEDAALQATIDSLTRQLQVQQVIASEGQNSQAAIEAQAAAAREVFEEMLAASGASEDLKEQARATFDQLAALASADIAGPISAAADEAARLAYNLASAVSAQDGFGALSVPGPGDLATGVAPGEFGGGLAPGAPGVGTPTLGFGSGAGNRTRNRPRAGAPRAGSSGGGRGGGGGAAAEANEVQDLIDRLQDELDVLRETDPLQRELLNYREVLATATAQEASDIEALVGQKLAERDAQEELNEQMQRTRALGADLVSTLVDGFREGARAGDILADMLGTIGDKLIDIGSAGLTDALFGTGQAGGGTGLFGGLLGSILGLGQGPKVKLAAGAVLSRPTYFDAGGGLGLMAEAGPEAIMPLSHHMGAGVGAVTGGGETTLPLTRLSSGKLGVDLSASAYALGGVFGDLPAARAPASWREAPAGAGVTINLDLRGAQMDDAMIARVEAAVQAAVTRAISPNNRAFNASVKSVVADTRRR